MSNQAEEWGRGGAFSSGWEASWVVRMKLIYGFADA
jgi:hypothetical protein